MKKCCVMCEYIFSVQNRVVLTENSEVKITPEQRKMLENFVHYECTRYPPPFPTIMKPDNLLCGEFKKKGTK